MTTRLGTGHPSNASCVATVPESATTDATERSMAPEMSPNVAPTETMARIATARPMSKKLLPLRKLGVMIVKNTISTIRKATRPTCWTWFGRARMVSESRDQRVPAGIVEVLTGSRPWAVGRWPRQ